MIFSPWPTPLNFSSPGGALQPRTRSRLQLECAKIVAAGHSLKVRRLMGPPFDQLRLPAYGVLGFARAPCALDLHPDNSRGPKRAVGSILPAAPRAWKY